MHVAEPAPTSGDPTDERRPQGPGLSRAQPPETQRPAPHVTSQWKGEGASTLRGSPSSSGPPSVGTQCPSRPEGGAAAGRRSRGRLLGTWENIGRRPGTPAWAWLDLDSVAAASRTRRHGPGPGSRRAPETPGPRDAGRAQTGGCARAAWGAGSEGGRQRDRGLRLLSQGSPVPQAARAPVVVLRRGQHPAPCRFSTRRDSPALLGDSEGHALPHGKRGRRRLEHGGPRERRSARETPSPVLSVSRGDPAPPPRAFPLQ